MRHRTRTGFLFLSLSLSLCREMPNMDMDPPADDQNNGQQQGKQGKQDQKQGDRKRPGDAAE